MKLEEQDKRISQEQQKEKRRIAKLQQEIGKTEKECHDLTNRIKVYIYCMPPPLPSIVCVKASEPACLKTARHLNRSEEANKMQLSKDVRQHLTNKLPL